MHCSEAEYWRRAACSDDAVLGHEPGDGFPKRPANGATQLTQISYNAQANVTSRIDPVGRQTNYTYAPNGIDVTQITQNGAGKIDTLGVYTYNSEHEPLTVTDAAGQTTRYIYNSSGQVLSVTNALNQTTTYSYNSKHYLTATTGANGRLAESDVLP